MRLRIATYNVRNLFVPGDAGVERSAVKATVALKAVARVLDLMAADIVALQEVGSQSALTALNLLLRAPYPFAQCVPGNSDRGIHLAYLARVPLTLASLGQEPLGDTGALQALRLQRDLLRAELAAGDDHQPLTLFAVHLKSKAAAPDLALGNDELRAHELAYVLAHLAEVEVAARPAVLLGDFNDLPSSDALTGLRRSSWVDALVHDQVLSEDTGRLPGSFWPRRRARIDRVMLNPAAAQRLVRGSSATHSSTLAQRGSDHYPVSVDLRL